MSANEDETPDEWTVLAKTYTSVLVPSFAPIYEAIAAQVDSGTTKQVLDFGCGPGEPALTLLDTVPTLEKIVAVDSTQPMLDIATERAKAASVEEGRSITFHHVRRDVTMRDLASIVGMDFDWIVSAFVMHYVPFPRRAELVSCFMQMSPKLLLVTWGDQDNVGWLRAMKIFGTWKGDTSKDICEVVLEPKESEAKFETPTGSFTMAHRSSFEGILGKVNKDNCDRASQLKMSFETKAMDIEFPSVKALLSFLPMPRAESDVQAMWKLLQSFESKAVRLGDDPDLSLIFPTEVVFCEISRCATKHSSPPEKDTTTNKRAKKSADQ